MSLLEYQMSLLTDYALRMYGQNDFGKTLGLQKNPLIDLVCNHFEDVIRTNGFVKTHLENFFRNEGVSFDQYTEHHRSEINLLKNFGQLLYEVSLDIISRQEMNKNEFNLDLNRTEKEMRFEEHRKILELEQQKEFDISENVAKVDELTANITELTTQITQLKRQRMQDQLTIEKLKKKEKNQKNEINRKDQRISQLNAENTKYEQQAYMDRRNFSTEIFKATEKLTAVETENQKLLELNQSTNLEVRNLQKKLKDLENSSQELKTQLANSVDKYAIARSLSEDITKLIENRLVHCNSETVPVSQFDEVKKRITEIKECQICNEDYDDAERKPVTIKCGHIYCKSCMLLLSNSTRKCPSCRASFRKQDLISLNLNFGELKL